MSDRRVSFPSRLWPVVVALFAVSCGTKPRFDAHGLRSIEIRMDSEDLGSLLGAAVDHVGYPARVLIDGEEYRISISAAGNSTVRAPKKSFDLKFEGDARYRGAGEVRIGAMVPDPSLLRALVAFDVWEAAGVPHSWAEPAFVHLNDRIGGVYVFMEKVDEDFLANRGIEWERLYKTEGDADFGPTFEARLHEAFSGKPKPANLEAMLFLSRTLAAATDADFEAAVFSILDRASVVAYMAGAQILDHWDGFNKNLFYVLARGSRRISLYPWDFDLVWGGDRSTNVEAWYLNDLYSRLGRTPSFRADVDAKVTALLAGGASPAALQARVDSWKAKIAEGYAYDPCLGGANLSLDAEAARLAALVNARLSRLP